MILESFGSVVVEEVELVRDGSLCIGDDLFMNPRACIGGSLVLELCRVQGDAMHV